MLKRTILLIGLLASTGVSYTAVNADTCVYAVANAQLMSNGETQRVTFKGNICDDKMLIVQAENGTTFTGVLTRVTDEGVYVIFSGAKKSGAHAQSQEVFIAWDQEFSLNLTIDEAGDTLALVMTVSQR